MKSKKGGKRSSVSRQGHGRSKTAAKSNRSVGGGQLGLSGVSGVNTPSSRGNKAKTPY